MYLLALQEPLTEEQAAAIAGVSLLVGCFFMLVGLAIAIFVVYLLYSAQKRVPEEHRKLDPGLVWLLLIPVFNLVWNFFVFLKIPESYQSYFQAQGRTDVGDCNRSLGLAYAILGAVSLGGIIPFIGCVFGLAGLAALVVLIIFLVKITALKNQIPQST